jgi:hypothetical protein
VKVQVSKKHPSLGIKKLSLIRDPSVINFERISSFNCNYDESELKEENDADCLTKEIKHFPQIFTINRIREEMEDYEFDNTCYPRQSSRAMTVLDKFSTNGGYLKPEPQSLEFDFCESKKDIIEITQFSKALQEDMDEVYSDIDSIWANYIKLLKSKSCIIIEVLQKWYKRNYTQYVGKLTIL